MTDPGRWRYRYFAIAVGAVGLAAALHFYQSSQAPTWPPTPSRPVAAANARGLTLFSTGQHILAVDAYTQAIELDPTFAPAYCNRANARIALGDYEQAIEDATEAIRLHPGYSVALGNRALAHTRLKHFAEALADGEAAIAADPDNVAAMNAHAFRLATCVEKEFRNGPRAVQLAEDVCRRDRTPRHLLTLSAAYAEVGRFDEAIKLVEDMLPLPDPVEDEKARGLLGLLRKRMPYHGD